MDGQLKGILGFLLGAADRTSSILGSSFGDFLSLTGFSFSFSGGG